MEGELGSAGQGEEEEAVLDLRKMGRDEGACGGTSVVDSVRKEKCLNKGKRHIHVSHVFTQSSK